MTRQWLCRRLLQHCWALLTALLLSRLALAAENDAIEIQPDTLGADSALELDLGELEISGAVDETGARPAPAPRSPAAMSSGSAVTVITAEELAGAGSIATVLDRLPGADVKFNGGTGQLATVQLRGARASQVAVFVDGVPLPALGVPDLALLPLGRVERVEVQRGPAGNSFGNGALGGAINIVTTRTDSPAAPAETAAIAFGSNGMASGTWSRYSPNVDWHFSTLRARNNYEFIRSGGARARRQNNAAQLQQLWAGWRDGAWNWRAGALRLERGVPGSAEFPTLFADLREHAFWIQAQQPEARYALSWIGARFRDPRPYLNAGPLASDDQRWHFEYGRGRLAGSATPGWGLRFRADSASGDAAGDTLRWRGGLDLTHAWQGNFGDEFLWQVELGSIASSDAGIDPAASLSLSRACGPGQLAYLSAGYSVRHPDFSELYLPNMGGVRGNSELQPEQAYSAEVGFSLADTRKTLQAAAFWTEYADSILFLPVSAYAVEAKNTGKATVAGFEAAWRCRFEEQWQWDCGVTWLPLAELRGGTPLPQRSPLRLSAGLDYRSSQWRCGIRTDYAARTPVDMFGNLRTAPRAFLSLEMGRTIDAGELSLAISNFLDVTTARDSWNYPLPGREFNLTWRSDL